MSNQLFFSKDPPPGLIEALKGCDYPEYKALELVPVEGGEVESGPFTFKLHHGAAACRALEKEVKPRRIRV